MSNKIDSTEELKKLINERMSGWEPETDSEDGYYLALEDIIYLIENGRWSDAE